ncbi:unnamed protein product [Parascedosporium putredinis]|uniref:DUF8035 domain-containing protein n=1 Tax=Parascedosporium putredinis TaxID=1442378 RepID=A0A9P1GVI0_9PEZI|nr:unnamed protein product [Parascedosporium putredinis]CAI7988101.1 unnamed protein product [Parascedosporium putredinis]
MSHYREDYGRPVESSSRTWVRERSRERSVERTPAFLRDPRREAGPMVLRQREVETVSRARHRSPSPVYMERERFARRAHSVAPSDVTVDSRRVVVYGHDRAPSPEPRRGRSISRVSSLFGPQARNPSHPASSQVSWPIQDTEIDIYTSRNETEVDIRKTDGRSRSRSHQRPRVAYPDDRAVVAASHDRLMVDYKSRRRAHSAAPMPVRNYGPDREEAEEITRKIDSRGRWMSPGTERVRMDGAGGASAEVSWKKYSGVRRTQFIPERDDDVLYGQPLATMEEPSRRSRDSLSIHIVDEKKKSERRVIRPSQPIPSRETWTEITMDLVNREALKRMGYPFDQRPPFFYVMQRLSSRKINELVELTAQIRRERRLRNRHRVREQETDTVIVRKHKHRHYPSMTTSGV